MAFLLQPLLAQVEKLHSVDCSCCETFVQNLPLRSSELCALRCFDALSPRKMMPFENFPHQFSNWNSQLKTTVLRRCYMHD